MNNSASAGELLHRKVLPIKKQRSLHLSGVPWTFVRTSGAHPLIIHPTTAKRPPIIAVEVEKPEKDDRNEKAFNDDELALISTDSAPETNISLSSNQMLTASRVEIAKMMRTPSSSVKILSEDASEADKQSTSSDEGLLSCRSNNGPELVDPKLANTGKPISEKEMVVEQIDEIKPEQMKQMILDSFREAVPPEAKPLQLYDFKMDSNRGARMVKEMVNPGRKRLLNAIHEFAPPSLSFEGTVIRDNGVIKNKCALELTKFLATKGMSPPRFILQGKAEQKGEDL